MGLTNCTPQGVVGSLLLHLFALRSGDAPSELHRGRALALRLWRRDLSMRAFIEALFGASGSSARERPWATKPTKSIGSAQPWGRRR